MAFEGMDVDAARQVAGYIQNTALQDLTNALNQIDTQITGIQWTGTDQSTFVSNWQSSKGQLMSQIQTVLGDTVTALNNEISQQDSASAT